MLWSSSWDNTRIDADYLVRQKSTSEVHTSAGHIGQGRQSIGSPSNPPNKLWLRESVKGRFRDWVNRFRGLANLSEDALTRCPVFGSRGNRQPRQILFRIQILSKSRGVRDQSMTTQQHQLVQNQVRNICHILVHLDFELKIWNWTSKINIHY